MKKYILSFAVSFLLIGNALSQVKKVNTDIFGDFEVIVKIDNGTVTISSTGEIIDVDMDGSVNYYYNDYPERNGKIKSNGSTTFNYYYSDYPERNGKIKSIGSTSINYYYSDYPERNGKIKSIGAASFNYYYNDYPERNGKLASGERVSISDGITFKLKGG